MLKKTAGLIAAIMLTATTAVRAQDAYPSKPISMISPYQAGGTTELFARLLVDDMAAVLGKPIVIEQKPGAAGTIGARLVSMSKPDGYTLLANTSQHVMYRGMYKQLPFDPMKDFQPVGQLGSSPILVVVADGSPYKTLKDVLAAAKTKNLTFASGAMGSLPHLTGELVASKANIKMTHVAYNGTAPALTDVLGGHVDLLFSTAASVEQQIRAGKLRALAVSTKERMRSFPDVPTIAESGMPGFDVTAWYGVWAPKGTDPAVIRKLNDAMRKASALPAVQKRMSDFSVVPSNMTAEEFAAFTARQNELWLDVMKTAKIQPN
ncbi:tripartite-type tricarboxylate transporter receptor subunit TctC [Cupriavidus gilardii J11]|uniref:Tripartite-type tricarboxylate transporter receptor subunit TctC n=1 Tax=Cupriavidus gilardii J11 TaxID=936133 RepID=A0A562BTI5_9BURK|nr:tripartite tricarboxylate transporter substrate binding protein [Cupriavidus gilardii]TWG88587.1 tripartite-type tricarboxylate transporter receptor subunit TctC [Cupriavidus gilardii J11]